MRPRPRSRAGEQQDPRPPRAGRHTCYRCFKPAALCVCRHVERVPNRTHVYVLQHPRERFHAVGTARIARLALARAELRVPLGAAARSLHHRMDVVPGTGLLFPREGSRDLATLAPDERPAGLVVLDGTWSQARRLYEHNEGWLGRLPHYHLTPAAPTRYRIRRAPRAAYVSTVEAIATALAVLEPDTPRLDSLLDAFEAMIDEQAAYAHRSPRVPLRKRARRRAGASPAAAQGGDPRRP